MCSNKRENLNNLISASTIILDIEGTTTSISFVKDELFPYVRKHLREYVQKMWKSPEFDCVVEALKHQAKEDSANKVEGVVAIPETGEDQCLMDAVVDNVLWQMDGDRKTKALKDLQGLIMEEGYTKGDLKGHIFDDVEPNLKDWVEQNKSLYIYSSGSVHAQKLLFGHSVKGDLLPLIKGHFDTTVGMKGDVQSYKNILAEISCDSSQVAFLTDVPKEARAAQEAGITAILLSRDGNAPLADEDIKEFSVVSSFNEIHFENNSKRAKLSDENNVTDKNKQNSSCLMSLDNTIPFNKCEKVEAGTATNQKDCAPADNEVVEKKLPEPITEGDVKSTPEKSEDKEEPVNSITKTNTSDKLEVEDPQEKSVDEPMILETIDKSAVVEKETKELILLPENSCNDSYSDMQEKIKDEEVKGETEVIEDGNLNKGQKAEIDEPAVNSVEEQDKLEPQIITENAQSNLNGVGLENSVEANVTTVCASLQTEKIQTEHSKDIPSTNKENNDFADREMCEKNVEIKIETVKDGNVIINENGTIPIVNGDDGKNDTNIENRSKTENGSAEKNHHGTASPVNENNEVTDASLKSNTLEMEKVCNDKVDSTQTESKETVPIICDNGNKLNGEIQNANNDLEKNENCVNGNSSPMSKIALSGNEGADNSSSEHDGKKGDAAVNSSFEVEA